MRVARSTLQPAWMRICTHAAWPAAAAACRAVAPDGLAIVASAPCSSSVASEACPPRAAARKQAVAPVPLVALTSPRTAISERSSSTRPAAAAERRCASLRGCARSFCGRWSGCGARGGGANVFAPTGRFELGFLLVAAKYSISRQAALRARRQRFSEESASATLKCDMLGSAQSPSDRASRNNEADGNCACREPSSRLTPPRRRRTPPRRWRKRSPPPA